MDYTSIQRASDRLKYLSCLMVENAGCGHPGAPLGQADFLTVLFSSHLRMTPEDPSWLNRDRFILSCGHACAGLYALYHSCGYDFSMHDLQRFRKFGSKTAGHPEYSLPIEATTGPLSQGLANGVGQAIAQSRLRALLGQDMIDYRVYVCVSDGCLAEGLAQEALSLAGHLQLNNLIVLYDSNDITIDGALSKSFSENIAARMASLGWSYQRVDGHNLSEIDKSLSLAKTASGPQFIEMKTCIGHSLSEKVGTEKCHGSPVGEQILKQLKQSLNIKEDWDLPQEHYQLFNLRQKFHHFYQSWCKEFEPRQDEFLQKAHRVYSSPVEPSQREEATRKTFSRHLHALVESDQSLIGGSCDLDASCYTSAPSSLLFSATRSGNSLAYGVREHGAAAISNGLAQAGLRPFCATFLVFSDFMLPAIRLSALASHRVLFIFTHDSLSVGEDGPTHQPVEQLTHLRDIPNLKVFRPHNDIECQVALKTFTSVQRPIAMVLSRQRFQQYLPINDASTSNYFSSFFVIRASQKPQCVILSSGADVALAVEAARYCSHNLGIDVDVLSIPCLEDCPKEKIEHYRAELAPLFIALECSTALHWTKYVPFTHLFRLESFGHCGPATDIMKHVGMTPGDVAQFIESIRSGAKPKRKLFCPSPQRD